MEKPGTEFTHEVFDMRPKTCKTTRGRLPEMPAAGPVRERSQRSMQDFSASSSLFEAWIDCIIDLHSVFAEAARRVHERMVADAENGEISSEVQGDFYKTWLNTYSQTFKEFLSSEHFASDMGTLISCFVDFQRTRQELFDENYLKPEGFPTRAEINGIYKEIYSLKKTVKGLSGRVRELSGNQGTIPDIRHPTAIYSEKRDRQDVQGFPEGI